MLKVFSSYRFKPKLIPTLVTLLLFPILISLGFWQLHRADFKQQLQTQYEQRQQARPLSLADIAQRDSKDLIFYPIQLVGHFDYNHPILLDNKMYQHRPGYHVLIPFFPAATASNTKPTAILVNLGWISQGTSRATLPKLDIVRNQTTVQGIISMPAAKAFRLGKMVETNTPTWPMRVEIIDLQQLSAKLGYVLQTYIVQLAPTIPYGYVREWSPLEMKAAMHKAYATQWFWLATTLLIIYFLVNLHRR